MCLYVPGMCRLARTTTPAAPIQLLARQAEIGLTVYQTNYSDFDDDSVRMTIYYLLVHPPALSFFHRMPRISNP